MDQIIWIAWVVSARRSLGKGVSCGVDGRDIADSIPATCHPASTVYTYLTPSHPLMPCPSFCLSWTQDELRDAVLLVFANKQDLPNAMNAAEITDKLGLHSLRQRHWCVESSRHCPLAVCLQSFTRSIMRDRLVFMHGCMHAFIHAYRQLHRHAKFCACSHGCLPKASLGNSMGCLWSGAIPPKQFPKIGRRNQRHLLKALLLKATQFS